MTVWFYGRLTGTMTMDQAINVGLLAGFLGGVFGFLFVMARMAGTSLVIQLDQDLPPEQIPYLFMRPTALILNLMVVVISISCGLIGGAIWQDKVPAATIPNQ